MPENRLRKVPSSVDQNVRQVAPQFVTGRRPIGRFRRLSGIIACVVAVAGTLAQAAPPPRTPDPMLPADLRCDPAVPTPRQVLGFPVGQRHARHDQLVSYFRRLAEVSPRVRLRPYGHTYGGRPLMVAIITSAQNHVRLETLRTRHLELTRPGGVAEDELDSLPVVVYAGASVHGDEASGANAALLAAYVLAAGQGEPVTSWLDHAIVLLDPCLNPDGFDRFANWANAHRGAVPRSDPQDRQHQQPWPGGRTNYYWFDLNRDWLPAVHPESQGRLRIYRRWMPNVVLDFHEMGSSSSYFFQPGVPERDNPLTPAATYDLTRRFADYHARAMDARGELYFTQERFDDFYMGKGSTYPDLHGAVGILFEQASSRGTVQQTSWRKLTFRQTIANQLTTFQSSLRAAIDLRPELLRHLQTFYCDAPALARQDKIAGYLIAAPADPTRLAMLVELLHRHGITTRRLADDQTVGKLRFPASGSWFVPCRQREYRFVKALFERRTQFRENVFYDVSTWTLPLAFACRWCEVANVPPLAPAGEASKPAAAGSRPWKPSGQDVAYLLDWRDMRVPAVLARLLQAQIDVRVVSRPITIPRGGAERRFPPGTLMIPLGPQPARRAAIHRVLAAAAAEGVMPIGLTSGLIEQGPDLGSGRFQQIPRPRIALVTGSGVRSSEAGEVWHLLDRRLGVPATLVDLERIGSLDGHDYTTLVMPGGSYGRLDDERARWLSDFLRQGGTVVATTSAIEALRRKKLVSVHDVQSADADSGDSQRLQRRPYQQAATDKALSLISGAILGARVDRTHPVGYGFTDETLPLFRNHRLVLMPSENPYATPVVYDRPCVLSGYVPGQYQQRLSESAAVLVQQVGRGRIVMLVDDPTFRAFWVGSSRLLVNSIFFGPLIQVP